MTILKKKRQSPKVVENFGAGIYRWNFFRDKTHSNHQRVYHRHVCTDDESVSLQF